MKIVVASGFFNPLHCGHIRYLEEARQLGDRLVVIVNNDAQVRLKGSVEVMPELERLKIVGSLRAVDGAILSIDAGRSVSRTLEYINHSTPVFVFANGGDVDESSVREREVCERLGIQIVCGVGGREKVQSSSELIAKISRAGSVSHR